jgi:uncharacterized damage-inducible protein DinB
MTDSTPEYWLKGSVDGIPAVLQPAAHALLQTRVEARTYTRSLDENLLWKMPNGRASVGFHLQHITGVIDRMLTYAHQEQFDYLDQEGNPNPNILLDDLLLNLENKIDEALLHLRAIDSESVTSFRSVGRKELPSTLIGVLFHAAEHSQRHIGQLLVTVSALKTNN